MNIFELIRKTMEKLAVSCIIPGLLSGCGPKAVDFSILPAGQSTYQGNVANNKVDILWVIDNSGSMYTKQEKLGQGFNSFATVFTSKDFDFQMAVTTTDIRATPIGQAGEFQAHPYPYQHPTVPAKSLPANYVGAAGPSVGILTNSTVDLVNHFTANVRVGDNGNANATALDAIELALSPAHLAGVNSGFLRDEAHLAVIVVSDADDNDSLANSATVIAALNALKPDKFDVISRTYRKNYTISAVAVDTANTSNAACPIPFENGLKFQQLVNTTSGSFASICEADFSVGLNRISQRIAEAITEIVLAQVPDARTITVTFNGVAVANDPVNGWTYSHAGNKLVFHGDAIPRDNTNIGINYVPNDIIR